MRRVYGEICCDRCGAVIKKVKFRISDVTDTRMVPVELCDSCKSHIDRKSHGDTEEDDADYGKAIDTILNRRFGG